ncbi:MAG: hypothetical protein RMJ87_02575 [Cytophagales bacterium]|nr:hypothetical protein [Bernardetiaceae bacterium]MDW8203890.1 hypothetical protein [Cytophagales bacterium]
MEWLLKPKEIVSFQQKPELWEHFGSETIWGIVSTCIAIYSASIYSRVGFLIGLLGAFFNFRYIYLDWHKKFINRLVLTPFRLSLSLGARKQQIELLLNDIAQMEVRYVHSLKGVITARAAHHEFERLLQLIQQDNHITADCYLILKNSEKITLRAAYFPGKSFVDFVSHLHQFLTNHSSVEQASLAQPDSCQDAVTLHIQAIMKENQAYLQADLELKMRLEQAQRQAYEMLYVPRDEFDRQKMVGQAIIAQFVDANQKNVYFFKDDYKQELEADEIEAGENLIQSANDNLQLVNARIESYQKIARELQRLTDKHIKRQQLNRLANNLKELQEENTARTIQQNSLASIQLSETDFSTLEQLAQLNEQVAQADTLEKTLLLREHIALFKK